MSLAIQVISNMNGLRRMPESTILTGDKRGGIASEGALTVTRGTLEHVGPTIPYRASTCPGMSGSCVLYKGAVVGS